MNNSDKDDTAAVVKKQKAQELLALVPEGESPRLYLNLVKETIIGVDKHGKPRPDADFKLFLYACKQTGLNPLMKQIYAVYRWDTRVGREVMSIQTGIDGFRLIAQRTGLYAGSDDPIYDNETEQHPNKATVTVYKLNEKTGERMPITATARWDEYCQRDKDGKPSNMWGRMPYNQLAKCAEALALRKGFPNELAGIYTDDEMAQANNQNIITDLPKPSETVSGSFTNVGQSIADRRAALKGGDNEQTA